MAAGLPAEVLGEDVIRADVIEMLAGIKYHGEQPQTVDDWRFLLEAIRRSVSPPKGWVSPERSFPVFRMATGFSRTPRRLRRLRFRRVGWPSSRAPPAMPVGMSCTPDKLLARVKRPALRSAGTPSP
jgi:hypothetical protein